jgi:S1-C subfamily serine protease
VNLLDLAIMAFAVLAAIGGYRAGLVTRFLSWAGLVGGLAAGASILPWLVDRVGGGEPQGRFLVATGTLLGGAFAGQAVGLIIGARAHLAIPAGGRRLDRVAGSVAGVLGVLVGLWLLLPGFIRVPGELSDQALHSAIARFVATNGPELPHALRALGGLIDGTGIPQVFDAYGSAPNAGTPPAGSGISPSVLEASIASTVRVEGEACNRIQEGSGFVVAEGLIATNAHVVAGEKAPSVITPNGRRIAATVVHFDPDRDLALLRADVRLPPLVIGKAAIGDVGAVLGHPGGGPLVVSPFKVHDDTKVVGRDLYDEHRTQREVLVLAAALRPGDSGAALVDASGHVVGVAFAIAPDNANTAYALATSELQAALSEPRSSAAVSSGPCLS